jgi:hypothetical protein
MREEHRTEDSRMATTICWKGTHNEDWPARAASHREVGVYEASGNRAIAAKHEEIARRHDRRAAPGAKKAAKAVTR